MPPKGNYVAYQALRPTELTVGDFISKRIDRWIAEGRAADAAKLKRLQEEGKSLMELNKDIKIDGIQTILPIQQATNKLTKDAIDAKSYAMRIAENSSIPLEQRREAYRLAQAKADNMVLLSKYLGSKDFVEGYANKIKTSPNEIWEGDDSLQFVNALATGDHDVAFDDKTGSIMVAFPNQNQTSDQKVEWRDFTEVAMKTAQPYEKDLSNDIDDFAKKQASQLYIKETDGRGGNRTITQNKFLKDDAQKTFESTFGGFDVNSKDPMLKQFSYSVLGKRQIQNQEDYDKVREAWVNKLESYVPKEYSVKDEKSALEIEKLKWETKNAQKNFYKQDQPAKQDDPLNGGSISSGNVILNIKTDNGKNTSHLRTQAISFYPAGTNGKASKVGVSVYWNPNALGPEKGGYSYSISTPSNDGKDIVIEGIKGQRAIQLLTSNKIKNPENILAMMQTYADQQGLANKQPTVFGKNWSNYKVNTNNKPKTNSEY